MTVNKRKKNSRQRGSWTHGWGAKKKHRGAGHRGGRGAAGSGKRGDAKKPSIWGDPLYAGKHGFISKTAAPSAPITIRHLEEHKKALTDEGVLVKQGTGFTLDLEKAGYTKLLATGVVTKAWHITVPAATPGAIEKIKKAGGSVKLTGEKVAAADAKVAKAEE
jgi:large subunit ribosomal protein L15